MFNHTGGHIASVLGGPGYKVGDFVASNKPTLGASYLIGGSNIPDNSNAYALVKNTNIAASGTFTNVLQVNQYNIPVFAENITTGSIFMANGSGLYKSTNKGTSFTSVATFTNMSYTSDMHISDTGIMYITGSTSSGTITLLKSTNDGMTFTDIGDDLYNAISAWRTTQGYTSVPISRSSSNFSLRGIMTYNNQLYVAFSFGNMGTGAGYQGIATSTNDGVSWTCNMLHYQSGGGNSYNYCGSAAHLYKATYIGQEYIIALTMSYVQNTGATYITSLMYKQAVSPTGFNQILYRDQPNGGQSGAYSADSNRKPMLINESSTFLFVTPHGILLMEDFYRFTPITAMYPSITGFADTMSPTTFSNYHGAVRLVDGGIVLMFASTSGSSYQYYTYYLDKIAGYTASGPAGYVSARTTYGFPSTGMFSSRLSNMILVWLPNSQDGSGGLPMLYRSIPPKTVPIIESNNSTVKYFLKVK